MKTLITLLIITLTCIVITGTLLTIAFYVALTELANYPSPDPITYGTGLYVESEQVQQTINGTELK